jgi:hypothetical protein
VKPTFATSTLIALFLLAHPRVANAGEPRLKPFVLAERTAGDLDVVRARVGEKLAAAGFQVAGSYAPYDGAVILVVTNPELKAAASRAKFAGYAAAQRVTITRVGEEVQVAYTNPIYMQHAYRMNADLTPLRRALEGALGRLEEYGPAEGLSPSELRDYHYMMGMEHFDEPVLIGRFDSHYSAVAAVKAGLSAGVGGTKLVYQIDLPDSSETVFGVGLADGCSGDAFIMKEIDFKPIRSTGHLPYEVLVSGPDVLALHARFRIAVDFPDLKMMGGHSFMNIRCAPGAIEGALRKAVDSQRPAVITRGDRAP